MAKSMPFKTILDVSKTSLFEKSFQCIPNLSSNKSILSVLITNSPSFTTFLTICTMLNFSLFTIFFDNPVPLYLVLKLQSHPNGFLPFCSAFDNYGFILTLEAIRYDFIQKPGQELWPQLLHFKYFLKIYTPIIRFRKTYLNAQQNRNKDDPYFKTDTCIAECCLHIFKSFAVLIHCRQPFLTYFQRNKLRQARIISQPSSPIMSKYQLTQNHDLQ